MCGCTSAGAKRGAAICCCRRSPGWRRGSIPSQFIRIHRSTILRRDRIRGLRHDGLGVWSVELDDGDTLRIGRTYLAKVKAMAGR